MTKPEVIKLKLRFVITDYECQSTYAGWVKFTFRQLFEVRSIAPVSPSEFKVYVERDKADEYLRARQERREVWVETTIGEPLFNVLREKL
jgi:hypothetical protein